MRRCTHALRGMWNSAVSMAGTLGQTPGFHADMGADVACTGGWLQRVGVGPGQLVCSLRVEQSALPRGLCASSAGWARSGASGRLPSVQRVLAAHHEIGRQKAHLTTWLTSGQLGMRPACGATRKDPCCMSEGSLGQDPHFEVPGA